METAASTWGLHAAWAVDGPAPQASRSGSDALDPSVRRQLLAELESALAFADFCCFIGQEEVSSCAQELVSIAQRLYEDTLSAIGPTAGRPTADTRTGSADPEPGSNEDRGCHVRRAG